MAPIDYNKVKLVSAKHPKPPGVKFTYGTAGFRMKAELLDSVTFRVGILASLRSKKLDSKTIGVMITASHNPEEDNGVKLVDPYGEMLEQSWEEHATKLANAESDDDLVNVIQDIIVNTGLDGSKDSSVVYARDTRPSGPALVAAVEDALKVLGAKALDFGVKTTPELHYVTRCLNTAGTKDAYGEPTEEGYFKKLGDAFRELVEQKPHLSALTVDAANGVGAPKVRQLSEVVGKFIDLRVVNDDIYTKGKLNFQCGADFVKTQQRAPPGMNLVSGMRACSLDGDADRIVYYYADEDGKFRLLDGDKIAGLAASFIIDLVRTAGIGDIKIGVVQTAYANGSSTAYLTNVLKVPVSCVPTGVKHLHHEAEKYDVGVYFEANGHGTVLFSSHAINSIRSAKGGTPEQVTAINQLSALTNLINQTVGDAISDMLFVESILMNKQITLRQWDEAYTDLPNRLVKVVVADRHIFKTTDAERKLVEPKGLQDKINAIVAPYTEGRSFVRPSGTEDVVRVYAEAATRQDCDELAFKIAGLVFDEAGGVGERPKEFL
ncbi:9754_t:CDS:10 [Paraglomus occultum]|uniref:Phosphoacetylglucosamine mutase n=1 Tax=Paraglomus occultum TaxID=144539 RepID=A0A9N9ASK7_9GLOM|nr:9754_t:CDS:10 [Paraglomus occultum]